MCGVTAPTQGDLALGDVAVTLTELLPRVRGTHTGTEVGADLAQTHGGVAADGALLVGTCYLEFREDQLALLLPVRLEMAIVLFGVPLFISSYCYSRLVCILGRGASHRRRKRVAGLAAATLLNFLVCFGPYNMSHIVGYIQGESPTWRSYVLLLSTLNSCVDPLVYYFSSSGFQADFQGLLVRLTGSWGA